MSKRQKVILGIMLVSPFVCVTAEWFVGIISLNLFILLLIMYLFAILLLIFFYKNFKNRVLESTEEMEEKESSEKYNDRIYYKAVSKW